MEMANRHVYLLIIISMCGVEEAYTSTIGGKIFSGRLDKPQVQGGRFTQASCHGCGMGDKSVICEGRQLRTVPSDCPDSTMKLYLRKNNISVMLNTSFQPYPNLITLDMSINKLGTIESAAFQPLKHLESLYLSENHNLVIPSSVPFQPLTRLVLLDMALCSLEDLPNDLMDWLPNLKYLYLWKNRLSSLNITRCKTDGLDVVKLSENKFQDLTADKLILTCQTLSLELFWNPVRYISEDALASLTVHTLGIVVEPSLLFNFSSAVARSTLNEIIFVDMDVRDIPVGVFRPLYDHPMDRINIFASTDLSLSKNFFVGLNCLDKLVLVNNFMADIEPEYFAGMSNLTGLGLMKNQITQINPHHTTWEINIKHLDLSENIIGVVYGNQLRGLSNLTFLNLSRNAFLSVLVISLYDGLESLELVDVTGSSLMDLALTPYLTDFYFADRIHYKNKREPFTPGKTLSNTVTLKVIDLRNSQLNRKLLWDSSASVSLFHGLVHLLELYLSNNPLGNLPEGVFEDNLSLAYLMMSNCKISSLAGKIFRGLQSLIYLELNGNNLFLISSDAFMNLPVLQALNINDNELMFVEEGAVERVPFLRNVSLSNNQLVAFNRSTWNTLIKNDLDYIDVSRNPLSCQCKYAWLHDLANSSVIFLHHNQTLCSEDSLSQLRGKPFLEFDPIEYCVPNILLLSTLPFLALALLFGLMLAFHNRWLIRYKLYLVKLAIIGYREMQDAREHDEFVFDLNIMFTEDDEVWAKEHLRPSLEERLPDYDRYSFGDEDLTLGMHYLEAVHYAVMHSFKNIVLLSRNAVHDNWFLIKFRAAMDHVHDELIENTVVIFLEDIPEDEIPYLVRLYLSDRRPYMRWPEAVRGQEYFWNELTKVVTVNLKYNPLIPPE